MKRSKTFSTPGLAMGMGAFVLLFATPAWANMPPGPQMLLAEILILPLMIILTALGGGYVILRAVKGPKKTGRWKIPLAVLVIIISMISSGLAFLVTISFCIIALVRGLKMLWWGVSALRQKGEPKPRLATAKPIRLIPAGIILVVLAIGLGQTAPAFAAFWGLNFAYHTESDLKDLVAYQMLKAKQHIEIDGTPVYEPKIPVENKISFDGIEFSDLQMGTGWRYKYFKTDFQLGPSAKSFQVWVTPYALPYFPNNYLISLPSFYADQTGAIRMIRVHHDGQKCPVDAPVYYQVGEEDLKRVAERLLPPEAPSNDNGDPK